MCTFGRHETWDSRRGRLVASCLVETDQVPGLAMARLEDGLRLAGAVISHARLRAQMGRSTCAL
jgi:hypothetical protein